MKILLSGASGLVGGALRSRLAETGHEITPLSRTPALNAVHWHADTYAVENPQQLSGWDAVIHLAGEPIIGRWTPTKKRLIRESRVKSTHALVRAFEQVSAPPRLFMVASATGYYGHRDEESLTEASNGGNGFLAEVCQAWEAAAALATDQGIRVVNLRFGIILSPRGGALKTMLPAFRWGVGGRLGDGRQYMSWITINDAVNLMAEALGNESYTGPINVVAPGACTNQQFTQALGAALSRPTILPVPRWGMRLAFGEMADELLLTSQRVVPDQAEALGFRFDHAQIEEALRALIRNPSGQSV